MGKERYKYRIFPNCVFKRNCIGFFKCNPENIEIVINYRNRYKIKFALQTGLVRETPEFIAFLRIIFLPAAQKIKCSRNNIGIDLYLIPFLRKQFGLINIK